MATVMKFNHEHNGDTFVTTFLPPLMSSLGNEQSGMDVRTFIWRPGCDWPREETFTYCLPVFCMLYSSYEGLCNIR